MTLRDNQGDRRADKTDAAMRQRGAKRDAQRAAADPFEEGCRGRSLPARGDGIGCGHDVQDAGQPACRFGVDPQDFCVRTIGAQEMTRNLAADVVIGSVSTPACDQSDVFPTPLELML